MANEKRLIDANAVMHKINAFAASVVYRGSDLMFTGKDSCNPHEYTRGYEQGILDAQKILGGQPTVDSVEVIRCKGCKHYNVYRLECHNEHMNGYIGIDGFCSYGERKDK